MRKVVREMGWLLLISMGITEGLLLWQGRWQEAIPLHLCSLSALAAFATAMGFGGEGLLDFLWYLGLPGALLALVFPAPAQSRCQSLMNASYIITHLMIVLIPLGLMRAGRMPRPGRMARMMLALQGIALCAFAVNEALGTNYLFLHLPPANSPLVCIYGWGYPAYLLALEGLMLAVCAIQSLLLRWFQFAWRYDIMKQN